MLINLTVVPVGHLGTHGSLANKLPISNPHVLPVARLRKQFFSSVPVMLKVSIQQVSHPSNKAGCGDC